MCRLMHEQYSHGGTLPSAMHMDLESCVLQNFYHAVLGMPFFDFLDAALLSFGLGVYVNHAYEGDFWGR